MARLVVAEDSVLLRRGLARVLTDGGHEVVAELEDATTLADFVAAGGIDLCIIDIRMPPTHTDEGLRAARRLRAHHPDIAVVVLSQYVDDDYVMELLDNGSGGIGYLLKDGVMTADQLLADIARVLAGGTVIDSSITRELLARRRTADPLSVLSERERDVLRLMAEGYTDRGIADKLFLSLKTVQAHTHTVFRKLAIPEGEHANRRVHAVLAWLRA